MPRFFHGLVATFGFYARAKAAAMFEKRSKKFAESTIVVDNEYGRNVSLPFGCICQQESAERGLSSVRGGPGGPTARD